MPWRCKPINATKLHYNISQSSCNTTATECLQAAHFVKIDPMFSAFRQHFTHSTRSVLAWPAWLRVLAVLPAVAMLWLAVAWAQLDAAPW